VVQKYLEKAFLMARKYFHFWPKPEGGQMTGNYGKKY